MINWRIPLALIICLFVLGCQTKRSGKSANLNDEVLREAITKLKKNSIESSKINWDSLESQLIAKYPTITNGSMRYEAINWMLKEFNFKHHTYWSSETAASWKSNTAGNDDFDPNSFSYPEGKMVGKDVGYIKILTFSSGDSLHLALFAEKAQKALNELINSGAKNWIVDLNKCQGGNMWPMVAGIGPILGEGRLGSFSDSKNNEVGTWYYEKGRGFLIVNDSLAYNVVSPFSIEDVDSDKIAVLQSNLTGSSGEAMLVAFLGKENVRTFGSKSATYSTSNEKFQLSDGSILWITTAVFEDINGNKYPDGIEPMVNAKSDSLALVKAIDWLNKR